MEGGNLTTPAGWVGRSYFCPRRPLLVQRLVEFGGGLLVEVHRFVETDTRTLALLPVTTACCTLRIWTLSPFSYQEEPT